MVGPRAALVLALALSVAACATAPSPSPRQTVVSPTPSPHPGVPSGSPQAAAPPDDPSPATRPSATPARSPGPLSVKEAGAALLAAQGRLRVAWDTSGTNKYLVSESCNRTPSTCSNAEWKALREKWGITAAALARYVEELKAIRFPAVVEAAAAAYIKAVVAFRDRALSASKATTLGTFNSRAAAAGAVRDGTFTDNEQRLLDALGLPVGP